MADIGTPLSTTPWAGVEPLGLEVCVASPAPEPGPLLDHFSSTLVAGVKISTTTSLAGVDADVLWVTSRLRDGVEPRRWLLEMAARGALAVVVDATLLDADAAGVPLSGARFPTVASELRPLQELLAGLLGAVDESDLPLLFGRSETSAAHLPGTDALVETDEGAWCARTRIGRGEILWLGLFPELDGAGFRVESHTPLRAAACQLLVDEVLAYAFRRKHGVSVRKVFGPYGAPMLAWQAHVEEIGGFWNRSMEHFVGRLANSRQVPTFSLIRRTFRWGQRVPGLVYLPWATETQDSVRAQPEGAAFFSGQWITRADGTELGFPAGDRYVDFHTLIPDLARVYPAPEPGGGLVLGTPDGRIERFSVSLLNGRASLTGRGPLVLNDGTVLQRPGASPTFGVTDEGRLLVVGDDAGDLRVYVEGDAGWCETARHALGGRVSPRLVDWTGSGRLDLMVGTDDGAVDLFEDFERVGVAHRTRLFETGDARVAPWPLVAGRRRRVLFGDVRGRLQVWEDGTLETLPSVDTTMAGSPDVYLQQDSVPVVVDVDGRALLVAGASIVGRAHTLGDVEEPVTAVARDSVARVRASGTPCNPHLFFFQGASLAEVSAELGRHRASFAALGLPWEGIGANQHGWWVPRQQAALAFLLQRASGLCFNFGWQSPGTRGAPDTAGFDAKYALAFPFLLRVGETRADFVLHAPALPDRHPRAHELMAAAGLPLTFFVHPEYRQDGAATLDVDDWIGAVAELKRRHGGVFVTENQMAKAIAVTLTSEVCVFREDSGALRLEADLSAVPPWAADYRRALAVTIEWPAHPPDNLHSDGLYTVRGRRFITSVADRTTVRASDRALPLWRAVAANGPIEVAADGVDLLTPGFQELHLAGTGLEVDWPGAHFRETGDGLLATRFGGPGRARIRTRPVAALRADLEVAWSPHESKQDRWVIEEVFRGRTTPGYFVETGAADGVSTSSTLALERSFGWTGIAVEPHRLFFEQLRKNRRCDVANVCVAEHSGPVEFIHASWFGRIRDHFREGAPDRDHLQDRFLKADLDGSPAKVVKMAGLSLEDLLLSHRAPRRIDFINIDAEFSEWFILKSFPFHRFEVLALCTHSKYPGDGRMVNSPHADDIRRLLCGLGYFYDRERSRHVQYDFFVHPNVIEHPLPDPAVRGRA
jgi:hypothetical protein